MFFFFFLNIPLDGQLALIFVLSYNIVFFLINMQFKSTLKFNTDSLFIHKTHFNIGIYIFFLSKIRYVLFIYFVFSIYLLKNS